MPNLCCRKVVGITKLLTVGVLAVTGMGSSCPGSTKSTSRFTNQGLTGLFAASSVKSWRAAQVVDLGAVDVSSSCLRHNQGLPLASLAGRSVWQPPMAVFAESATSFFVAFNREDSDADTASCGGAGVTTMNSYVAYNADLTATSDWIDSFGRFTQLDATVYARVSGALDSRGPSQDSIRPMTVVDSSGHAMLVNLSMVDVDDDGVPDTRVPVATRHLSGAGGAWSVPVIIADLANNGIANDVALSAALKVDANDNVVVAYSQNGNAYFNQFRPFLGWRFAGTGFPAEATWSAAATVDRGVALGFDAYGNGYGVYVTATDVVAARWRGDQADQFDGTTASLATGVTLGAEHGYPKIYVQADGGATAFYLADVAAGEGTLICAATGANSSSTIGAFGLPATFNAATAVASVDDSDPLGPILATYHDGTTSRAALGFIRNGAFYVYQAPSAASCSGWTLLKTFDAYGTVRWADLAVNSSGVIAAAFAVQGPGGFETVFGAIYNGSWSEPTRLDDDVSFTPAASGTPEGRTRPSVAIDSSGNVVVSYSKLDAGYAMGDRRRAVISEYR